MGQFLLVTVGVLLLSLSNMCVLGDQWHIRDYPNPREDPESCGREGVNSSFVCDPDGVLTVEQANQLDELIDDIRRDTKCPCSSYMCKQTSQGYPLGISLVKKMNLESLSDNMNKVQKTLNQAKLFAYTQLLHWDNMGQCNENIMVFYSEKDNVLWTMTGEVARKKLNDGMIGYVAISRRHEFNYGDGSKDKKNWIYSALKNILGDYRNILNGIYQPPSYARKEKPRSSAVSSGTDDVLVSMTIMCLAITAALIVTSQQL